VPGLVLTCLGAGRETLEVEEAFLRGVADELDFVPLDCNLPLLFVFTAISNSAVGYGYSPRSLTSEQPAMVEILQNH
jgi:hypothetical protein